MTDNYQYTCFCGSVATENRKTILNGKWKGCPECTERKPRIPQLEKVKMVLEKCTDVSRIYKDDGKVSDNYRYTCFCGYVAIENRKTILSGKWKGCPSCVETSSKDDDAKSNTPIVKKPKVLNKELVETSSKDDDAKSNTPIVKKVKKSKVLNKELVENSSKDDEKSNTPIVKKVKKVKKSKVLNKELVENTKN